MVQLKETACVLGLGYIGLPLTAALANAGYNVIGVDLHPEKIENLKNGITHIYEPGLKETLVQHKDRIEYTTEDAQAIKNSDIIFIAVGTPLNEHDEPNYSQLNSCLTNIGKNLKKGQLVFLKSTAVLGTTEFHALPMLEKLSGLKAGTDFYLAFSPERTSEGQVMHEFHTLPKIVGGINAESTERGVKVIRRLGGKVTAVSSPRVAEICKLLDNLYRATNIAFANEVGELCENAGINAEEVVSTVNAGYLRTMIYKPGLGADGPCLSKDPKIYKYSASRYNSKVPLAEGSIAQNESSTKKIIDLIKDFNLSNNPDPLNIAIIGAAFKGIPETDDTRDSTGEKVIKALKRSGIQINSLKVFDPRATSFLDHPISKTMEEAIQDSNVIMFLTNHPRIMNLEFSHIKDKIKKPAFIIDAWGNLSVSSVPEGIHYYRIGNGAGFPRENQASEKANTLSLSKGTSIL